jgi:Fe-S-cluster formation regulator IscX/YfhJ
VRGIVAALSLLNLTAVAAAAQTNDPSPTVTASVATRAPYLQRGDQVEKRYAVYRERLERFFGVLGQRLKDEAPELLPRIARPADVPYGYQILPNLLPNPPRQAGRSRVVLSPFSWNRTDSMIDRGSESLATVEARLARMELVDKGERRREYDAITDEYRKLEAGQKLMVSTIAYNRLWQGEIARQTQFYREARVLQGIALAWQRVLDSLSTSEGRVRTDLTHRADSLFRRIDEAIKKLPTPDFVRVNHSTSQRWVVSLPVFTDITDSVFVERVRGAVQDAWHVRDGDDEFVLILEIHRVPLAELYPPGDAPRAGAHIDIARHIARFPPSGVVLTTGGNNIYATGRSIILGPHAIPVSALAHEFGHMLGFKDGYFRSYDDQGADGYRVLEVILDPENVVAAPENGRVRREHFEQVLRDKLQ